MHVAGMVIAFPGTIRRDAATQLPANAGTSQSGIRQSVPTGAVQGEDRFHL